MIPMSVEPYHHLHHHHHHHQVPISTVILNLPRDIIIDILTRLPTKSLLHLRAVSTFFHRLISSPEFLKLHFSSTDTTTDDQNNHLILYYESPDYTRHSYSLRSPTTFLEILQLQVPFKSLHGYLRIVGSSKGVICFFDTNYFTYTGRVIFWNPSINKFKIIHDSHLSFRFVDSFSHMVVGFGFISEILDFKVVQILFDLDKRLPPIALIYCHQNDLWRKIEARVPCYIPRCWSNNVFVNGFVNWLAYKKPREGGVLGMHDCIMGFDLVHESFKVIDLPADRGVRYDQLCLSSKDGELLCVCFHFVHEGGDQWDLWEMGEYGVQSSWRRMYNIVQPTISLPPLSIRGDGEVLFVINHERLVLFDVNKEQVWDLEVDGVPSSFRVVNYTSTLALLNR